MFEVESNEIHASCIAGRLNDIIENPFEVLYEWHAYQTAQPCRPIRSVRFPHIQDTSEF